MENLGVVILNYLTYEDSIACAEQFLEQNSVLLKIVIVDNCSPNDSFEMLFNHFKGSDRVTVIQSEFNGGYAYGNNIGIRFLETITSLDTIIISNNDIKLSNSNLVHDWYQKHKNSPNVGLTAPVMLVNGSETNYSAWKLPLFIDDFKSNTVILEKIFGDSKVYEPQTPNTNYKMVDCLPGSLFMISIKNLKSVGYMDEGTFLYMEEAILSYKLKSIGLRNFLFSALSYEHSYSKTISSNLAKSKVRRISFESKLFYATKLRKDNYVKLLLLIFAQIFGDFVIFFKRVFSIFKII